MYYTVKIGTREFLVLDGRICLPVDAILEINLKHSSDTVAIKFKTVQNGNNHAEILYLSCEKATDFRRYMRME